MQITRGPIDKDFFIEFYKFHFDSMTNIKSKNFSEDTLIKLVSKSNKFYNELVEQGYPTNSDDVMSVAVLREIRQDIDDTKVVDTASELEDNIMDTLFVPSHEDIGLSCDPDYYNFGDHEYESEDDENDCQFD